MGIKQVVTSYKYKFMLSSEFFLKKKSYESSFLFITINECSYDSEAACSGWLS